MLLMSETSNMLSCKQPNSNRYCLFNIRMIYPRYMYILDMKDCMLRHNQGF